MLQPSEKGADAPSSDAPVETGLIDSTGRDAPRALGPDRFLELVQSIEGLVWEAELSSRGFAYTFVSDHAQQLLGYPAAKWIEDPNFWREPIHPDDRTSVLEQLLAAVRERQGREHEYRMVAADGRVLRVRDQVSVVVEKGRVKRLVGVMTHDTDLRREEVKDLAVGERFVSPIALDWTLLRSLNHELRTPLTAILGHAELLLHMGLDADGVSSARAIKRNSEALVEILEGAMAAARSCEETAKVEFSAFEAGLLLDEVHASVRSRAEDQEVALGFEWDRSVSIIVESDAELLQQALKHLLSALLERLEKGRMRVVMSQDEATQSLRLDISTSIEGLSREERILLTDGEQGVELGNCRTRLIAFSLLARSLKLRTSRVAVADFEACLRLEIPLRSGLLEAPEFSQKSALHRIEKPSYAEETTKRVLVVEDHGALANILAATLEAKGHEVRTAQTAAQASELLQSFVPEVGLIDLGLPDLSGIELLTQVKGHFQLGETVWIALSGRAEPEDIEATREAGFRHHVRKPPDMEKLEELIAAGP